MKLVRILLLISFIIPLVGSTLIGQDIMKKKKSGESKYILNDSTGSYLIRELSFPDGTKSYSLIPKSYMFDTAGIEKNLPQSLQDWFYKNRNRSGNGASLLPDDDDSLNYLLNKNERADTSQVLYQKKNSAAWWIVGSTTLIGGVAAYYFLKYRKGVEELPIQPDPPK